MTIDQRVDLFSALGKRMAAISSTELDELSDQVYNQNNWFTTESVATAFKGVIELLQKDKLEEWVSRYILNPGKPKEVGVVMAGNIPMVGFHDLLCVLISGHRLMIKASSNDTLLIKWVIRELCELEPKVADLVCFEDKLNQADAIIATGSDNSARYFEYYFSGKPHIIRKNRTSCAILNGNETKEDIANLGRDIFTYFGLGCRNVSKLYVPKDYDFKTLLDGLSSFEDFLDHHKYKNNYDYNKSIYLINLEPHLDSGFLLLRESDALVSPISVVFFENYESTDHLEKLIASHHDKLQCVVGDNGAGNVPFGQAQFPQVSDYADNIDTLSFLSDLN